MASVTRTDSLEIAELLEAIGEDVIDELVEQEEGVTGREFGFYLLSVVVVRSSRGIG